MTRRIAIVLGGAGFLGRAVVQKLAAEDYDVRVPIHRTGQAQALRLLAGPGNVTPVPVFLHADSSILSVFKDATVVVNLIGIAKERKTRSFQETHVELAASIARLARAAGVKTLVHVSSLGANALSDSAFARSKALGESAVQAFFPEVIIFRPSLMFGPGDTFFNRWLHAARFFPVLPFIGINGPRIQPVYVGDVARAITAAIKNKDSRGRTYDLGGPKTYGLEEALARILTTAGLPTRFMHVPLWAAHLFTFLPLPFLTRDLLHLLQTDFTAQAPNAGGFENLGLTPRALEDVLPEYVG